MRPAGGCAWAALLTIAAAACGDPDIPVGPPATPDLDVQLRDSISRWGVIPVGAMPAQNPALVALGQALMFDKILSGNRDISCATCHQPALHGGDGVSLAIGTGGSGVGTARTLGAGRQFISRNAPSLLDQGLRSNYIFWDGRVSSLGFCGPQCGGFDTPAKTKLPGGITNILAAQAMFPVTNRQEMRGEIGDTDVSGNPNELAHFADTQFVEIWQAVMRRLVAIPEYVTMFGAAFPGVPVSGLGFEHAAAAIAAFEMEAFTKVNSPFDRFLNRENAAMTAEQKRGGIVFFGRARCASCHGGPLLGGTNFANDGVPQIGPGTAKSAPLDRGRADAVSTPDSAWTKFQFRVPPLRNVELTAPYMHDGAYPTLEAVVLHYNDVPSSLRTFDPATLAPDVRPLYHGESATIAAVSATIDPRLRQPLALTELEKQDLVAFLKSLTDPAARDLSAIVPARVPSGLPVD